MKNQGPRYFYFSNRILLSPTLLANLSSQEITRTIAGLVSLARDRRTILKRVFHEAAMIAAGIATLVAAPFVTAPLDAFLVFLGAAGLSLAVGKVLQRLRAEEKHAADKITSMNEFVERFLMSHRASRETPKIYLMKTESPLRTRSNTWSKKCRFRICENAAYPYDG